MSANPDWSGVATSVTHSDPIAPVIFGVTLILIAARVGRRLARRTGQPPMPGKLMVGLLLGNVLAWSGYGLMRVLREGTAVMDLMQVARAVNLFSRYGVISLLFHVGLETCVSDLRNVGADSFRVALPGALAPVAD